VSPPRCVVFDVDDTLYLEADYVRSGFVAVDAWAARELGLDRVGSRAWEAFQAGHRGDLFDRALVDAGRAAPAGTVARLVEVYRSHAPNIRLLEDARECLDRLRGRARLAALTDGPLASQRAKCEALGLRAWCSPIVLTAELGPGMGKPNSAGFERIEGATGCRGTECAYVADNPLKDFGGPARLGWRRVRVRRAGGLHQALPSGADVEHEVPSLRGLDLLLGVER